jgi:hypothetical protein
MGMDTGGNGHYPFIYFGIRNIGEIIMRKIMNRFKSLREGLYYEF